jgi:hypothetical protein
MKQSRISYYKVTFSDGFVSKVPGCYAAHAWAVAKRLWPNKEITGFQLLEDPENKATVP